MGFSVGDRVICSADKVLGNKPAKQRYHDLVRDIPCHATALKFCYDVSHSVLRVKQKAMINGHQSAS